MTSLQVSAADCAVAGLEQKRCRGLNHSESKLLLRRVTRGTPHRGMLTRARQSSLTRSAGRTCKKAPLCCAVLPLGASRTWFRSLSPILVDVFCRLGWTSAMRRRTIPEVRPVASRSKSVQPSSQTSLCKSRPRRLTRTSSWRLLSSFA